MPFDTDKLAASIERSAEPTATPLPRDRAAELVRMVGFFAAAQAADRIVPATEIATWTEKVLRETGHHGIARAYAAYAERKRWAVDALGVHDELAPAGADAARWDKGRLVRSLRAQLNLESGRARDVASCVERAILAARFTRLTTGLVRELVNNELARGGDVARLAPAAELRIPLERLRQSLGEPGGPAAAGRSIAGRVWREFALREIVSSDVAEAARRGLLRMAGLDAPGGIAAACVDASGLVRQSAGAADFLSRLGSELALAARSCALLVAVGPIEPALALSATRDDAASELAERCWQELQSRLRHTGLVASINLCAGFPGALGRGVGAGPLFDEAPAAPEHARAAALGGELLDRFQRDAADWPGLRADWHWPETNEPERRAAARRALRLAAEGYPVSLVFPRQPLPLGEALRRGDAAPRAVLDFIGLRLPLVWRDAGCPRSWLALENGLTMAAQLAVRAAVQKREFMRGLRPALGTQWLERALLAVTPIGLDWTVGRLSGGARSFAEDDDALALAETLVRHLRETLEREARCFGLGVVLDAPPAPADAPHFGSPEVSGEELEGLAPVASGAGPRRRIYAAGRLHAIAGAGTLSCPMAPAFGETLDKLEETIDWACGHTGLVRLRLAPLRPTPSQATVAWPEP